MNIPLPDGYHVSKKGRPTLKCMHVVRRCQWRNRLYCTACLYQTDHLRQEIEPGMRPVHS